MTEHASPETARKPRHVHRVVWRRRTRIVAYLALGCIIGLTIAAAYVRHLAVSIPPWFHAAGARDPERAIAFENALLTECSKVRPVDPARTPEQPWRSEPWAVAMEFSDLNEWLQHQGPRWATHEKSGGASRRWAQTVRSLRLAPGPSDELRIGVWIDQDDVGPRFFALCAVPEVRADGVWLQTREVEIGEISLKASWAMEQARRAMQQMAPNSVRDLPEMERLLDAASGMQPLISRPVIRLADGRRVHILAIRIEGSRLILTCQTEAPNR